ncbi:MAG: PfkB family carbohydrate kinase, partial [Patescibacteria group bacterium]|nr:PfkB family carbohydrate kinase [Patescibacteria group bacterium]
MNKKSSTLNLLVIGSVAFDDIETPFGKSKKTLGGSATYISLAASYFTRAGLVAVVGEDFKSEHCNVLQKQNVDLMGLEMKKGRTFAWGGKYHFDLNTRETLFTHLNVFENFSPVLSPSHRSTQYVFLGNTHPAQQIKIINQLKNPKFVGLDTMNYWIEKTPKELGQVLKLVDALVINDSEARELSKEHNLLKAAKKISGLMHKNKKRLLVIKRGEYGLLLFQGNKIFHLPGFPLE